MKILVTGGTGYIGSHTAVALIEAGYEVVIVDDLSNSSKDALSGIAQITGVMPGFYEEDVRDRAALTKIFEREKPHGVIHFAAKKAVGESVEKPLLYYDVNVCGTLCVLGVMREFGVFNFVYSSSATVYGADNAVPFSEDAKTSAVNPYGSTKVVCENILQELSVSDARMNSMILRYFNPVGAHVSGLIGEKPDGIPNNLMPYVAQVAAGTLPKIRVFGDDYDTPDGTGVRDYIHVCDLADGHLKALHKIEQGARGIHVYNLGAGRGYSVLEMIAAFSRASGREIPYEIAPRRAGDIACGYAAVEKAKRELSFEAKHGIERMCADTWRFQQNLK